MIPSPCLRSLYVATSATVGVPVISRSSSRRRRKLSWHLGSERVEVLVRLCCPSIWLTEGNAITVPQQYRPTKSLQVSDSWLPGLMRTSISVRAVQVQAGQGTASLKPSWCNHIETKPLQWIILGRQQGGVQICTWYSVTLLPTPA